MKRGLVALALLGGMIGVSACAPQDQVDIGAPTTASSPTAPASTPSAGPSAASVVKCRKASLSISFGGRDAGAGHRSIAVVFRNTGATSCQLSGYPVVAALDAADKQVAQAASTPQGYLGGLASGASIPTVTLSSGQSASALVEGLGFNASDGSACTAYKGFLVTAPEDTESTRLTVATDICSDLQVHPVVAGTTGRQ